MTTTHETGDGPRLADPTLSRLAHSVLWPGFTGVTAPDWLLRALEKGLGGAVYFSHNIDAADPGQVRALSGQIHAARGDALIGVDEEGGIVTRLEAARGSSVPGNAALGRIDEVETTERTARWIGRMVAGAGIDIDLAPTVDVNANPLNPVIGVRSFSADTGIVSRNSAAFVRGLQSAGVAACAKHFPGHGDTVSDSHLEPATSEITLEELREIHLPPFAAAIDAGVKAIMSAHIRIPALGDAPATVNPASLSIVRDLGFDGVIITDALDMAAIRETLGTGPGAVAALRAGADLLCVGNPVSKPDLDGRRGDEDEFLEPLLAVYSALAEGELPVARLEEAAERVRALAEWRAQHDAATGPDRDAVDIDGAALARHAAEVIGSVALRPGPILVLDARQRRTIAVGDAPDFFTLALREERHVTRVPLGGHTGEDAATLTESALASAQTSEVVLVVGQPQTSPSESAILETVLSRRPDTIVIYSGWPASAPPAARRALLTYGASRSSARAAAQILSGR